MNPEAQTIACPQCGGRVPFGVSHCTFCHTPLAFDRPAHQQVRASARAEDELLKKEAVARRSAVLNARAARHNGPMLALVLVFAVLLTWWFVAGVSGIAAKIPPSITIPFVAVSAAINVALGFVWASMMRQPTDFELGAVAMASCSNCGGFVPFDQGSHDAPCPYCGAHGLKPAQVAQALRTQGAHNLAAGQRDAESAVEQNWETASSVKVGALRIGPVGWGIFLFLMACGITAGLLWGILAKNSATYPTWWIWLAILGSTAGMIVVVVRGVKHAIAAKDAFERRFQVRLTAEMTTPPRRA